MSTVGVGYKQSSEISKKKKNRMLTSSAKHLKTLRVQGPASRAVDVSGTSTNGTGQGGARRKMDLQKGTRSQSRCGKTPQAMRGPERRTKSKKTMTRAKKLKKNQVKREIRNQRREAKGNGKGRGGGGFTSEEGSRT